MLVGIAIGSLWTLIVAAVVYESLFAAESSTARAALPAPTQDLPEWRRVWYGAAHSDIQWCKEQGWGTMRTLVVVEAALVTARKTFFTNVRPDLLIGIAAVASLLSVIHLVDLHRFARKVRTVADRILDDVPEHSYYLGPRRAHDRHHVFYLTIKMVVIGAVTTIAVLTISP